VQRDLLGELGNEQSSPRLVRGPSHDVEANHFVSIVDAQDTLIVEYDAGTGSSVDVLVAVHERGGRQASPIEGPAGRCLIRDALEEVDRVVRRD